jgi:hypothetical protein
MTPATACPRCGTFAELTDDGWRTLCANCHVAGRHPSVTAAADPGAMIWATFALWREFFWLSALIALLVGAPKALLRLTFETPWWFDFVWMVVTSYGEAVFLSMVALRVLGGQHKLDGAFERANERYVPVLLINVITNVLSTLGVFLCVVGMFVSVAFTIQALPISLYERLGVKQSMVESYRRGKSHFVSLALTAAVLTLPLIIAPMVEGAWGVVYAMRHQNAMPASGPFTNVAWLKAGLTLGLQLFAVGPQLFEFVAWAKLRPASAGRLT